jgi:hypothetical protein
MQNKNRSDPFSYAWYKEFKVKGVIKKEKSVILVISNGKNQSIQQVYIHSILNGINTQYNYIKSKAPEWFAWALSEPTVDLIIHDCKNATKAERSQVLGKITTENLFVVLISPQEDDNIEFSVPRDEYEFECFPNYKRMLTVTKNVTDWLEVTNCILEKCELKIPKVKELYNFNHSIYIGIEVEKSDLVEAITKYCKEYLEFKKDKKLYYNGPSHITLLHSRVYNKYPHDLLKFNSMVGSKVELTLKSLQYNKEISAFLVEIDGSDKTVDDRFVHITWEKTPATQSYLSNIMIQSEDKQVINFEHKIQGTVKLY